MSGLNSVGSVVILIKPCHKHLVKIACFIHTDKCIGRLQIQTSLVGNLCCVFIHQTLFCQATLNLKTQIDSKGFRGVSFGARHNNIKHVREKYKGFIPSQGLSFHS